MVSWPHSVFHDFISYQNHSDCGPWTTVSHSISLLVLTIHYNHFNGSSMYCFVEGHRHRRFTWFRFKPVLLILWSSEPSDLVESEFMSCLNIWMNVKLLKISNLSDDGQWNLSTWLSWFDYFSKSVWFDTVKEPHRYSFKLLLEVSRQNVRICVYDDVNAEHDELIWHLWPPNSLIM